MNIKAYQVYDRSMRSLERQYSRAIRREFEITRRLLLAEAVDRGIDQLGVWLDGYLQDLRGRIRNLGLEYSPEIERVATIFYDKQLRAMRRRDVAVPRADDVRLISQARPNIERVMTTDPAWVDQYKGLVMGTASQLVTAEPGLASRRLFGSGVVEGRASASQIGLNRAQVAGGLTLWASGNSGLVTMYGDVATMDQQIRKQVIATIDERTTDCCLRAHGQIVEVDDQFHLAGTPRFSDKMDYPPFHWNCRTSVALHHPTFEEQGVTTDEMRSAARDELDARQDGSRQEIHPSHAVSRR